MQQIKQQANNVNLDALTVGGDLINYITDNPTMLLSVIDDLNKNQKTTLLNHFCKLGNLKYVKHLVSKGAVIYNDNNRDEDPLCISAAYGHLKIVKYLVLQGADIHCHYEYALCVSAKNGYLDIVKYLVSNGAYIHINNEEPIYLAAIKRHLDIVEYLIEQGAYISHLNRCIKKLTNGTKILTKKLR